LNVSAFEICKGGCKLIERRSKKIGLSNVKVSQDNILKNPFSEKFDAAVMTHVSQHFTTEELDVAFKNISESLNSGGILIFDALVDKKKSIRPNTWQDVESAWCHFPMDTIEGLAKKHGFNVKEVSDFDEKRSSRGGYYHEEWGYEGVRSRLEQLNPFRKTSVVRPVKLKWIVLEKS